LRDKARWNCYRQEFVHGKWTKVPVNARTGRKARPDHPQDWGPLEDAVQFFRRYPNRADGVGYLFLAGEGEVGIDLDHAADPVSGEPLAWAAPLLRTFPTYVEYSPSGGGYHVVGLSDAWPFPDGTGHSRDYAGGKVEIYRDRHYLTFTGHRTPGSPTMPADVTGPLGELARLVWPDLCGDAAPEPDTNGEATGRSGFTLPTGPSDQQILNLLRRAANAEKFRRLYDAGDVSDYGGDDSAADCALCCLFVFYTRNVEQVIRLFNGSALGQRQKWTSREDYRRRTVKAALRKVKEHYDADQMPAATLTNYAKDAEGKKRPRGARAILQSVRARTDDFPRRVGRLCPRLFVPDGDVVCYLDSPAALFAWAGTALGRADRNGFRWAKGEGMLSQEQLFQAARQQVRGYVAVETVPHVPPVADFYYRHPQLGGGDGTALRRLLDEFRPATLIDYDLVHAGFLTPAWGGPAGARPAMLIEGEEDDQEKGRGIGKTALARAISHLYQGALTVGAKEDIDRLYTRLLSPGALDKRIAIIDNIKSTRFSWADLEALITCDTISGRQLYVGEGRRPNLLTWILTLNAAALSRDFAQRVVPIRLARPAHDPNWEERVWGFISANRWEILGDIAATLARPAPPLAGFSRWSKWEAAVLAHVAEPGDCQKVIAERQAVLDDDQAEAALIRDAFVSELTRRGYDPARVAVFIPAAVAGQIINTALNEHLPVPRASAYLNTLAIAELRKSNAHGGGRGWAWRGQQADLNATMQMLNDPLPVSPFRMRTS
jgi:hypothetical protein